LGRSAERQFLVRYKDFLADFSDQFHFLDPNELQACLEPGAIPSQALANALLYAGSNGIVYPSVRHLSGTRVACFRLALVFHPRRGQEYRITVGPGTQEISFEEIIHPL
jgi:hypothetical protein